MAAVITRGDGKVLMIRRRDNGHWEPPGGVLEHQESIQAGLAREVKEETGYHVEPGRLTGVYKNMAKRVVALVFTATITGSSHSLPDDEALEVAWLSLDHVRSRCDEAFSVRVLDALQDGEPAVRAHDGIRLLNA